MIIDSIRFYNFQAYYKEVIFHFPTDKEKNVSIIYAINDVGKSCFFRGITYCMYGLENKNNLIDLINVNSKDENDYLCTVTIFGNQDGDAIEITRQIKVKGALIGEIKNKDLEEELTIIKNGSEVTVDNEEKLDYINSIVHEDAAQYFFFDGEKINDYSISNSDKYKEAIIRILGIKEIKNTIEDLKKLFKEYENNRDSALEKLENYKVILQEKKVVSQQVNDYSNDCISIEANITAIDRTISQHEKQLLQFEDIREKVKQKQELMQKKHELTIIEDSKKKERAECFINNSSIILGDILFERIKISEGEDDETQDFINQTVKDFLNNLTKQNSCVCGSDISDLSKTKIEEFITANFVTDEKLLQKKEKNKLFLNIEKYKNHAIESKTAYLNINKELYNLSKDISEIEIKLIDLKTAIGTFKEEAGEKIIEDINRQEKLKEEAKNKLAVAKYNLDKQLEKLQSLEKQLAKHSETNEVSSKNQCFMDYSNKLLKVFEEYLGLLLTEKRREVEVKATEIFKQLTNNPRKYKSIRISDDYNLRLELTDGTDYEIKPNGLQNPSTGALKVISLSYIAGINKSSNFAAPVIIDNPLGLFSEEHRERVMKYLPNFSKQVIFMVSKGDLNDKFRSFIEPFIKTEYYLFNKGNATWAKTSIEERKDY